MKGIQKIPLNTFSTRKPQNTVPAQVFHSTSINRIKYNNTITDKIGPHSVPTCHAQNIRSSHVDRSVPIPTYKACVRKATPF